MKWKYKKDRATGLKILVCKKDPKALDRVQQRTDELFAGKTTPPKLGKMRYKYPIKLEIEAIDKGDKWTLRYKEYFSSKDFQAFKNAYRLTKEAKLPNLEIHMDERLKCITIELKAERGRVFDYLCGEFLSLSNIAQTTIQELFLGRGMAELALASQRRGG